MTRRRGMSLMEVTVAGVLLGVLLAVCLQMLAAMAGHRRALEERQTAIVEASNVIERLSAAPWDALVQEEVAAIDLSDWAKGALPEGRLDVEVTPSGDSPEARRIVVAVHWRDASGNAARPVRLVAWRYRVDIAGENTDVP